MIRILIAEDQVMVREAIASLLELDDDFAVVAQVGRGDEVLGPPRARRTPTSRCSTSRCPARRASRSSVRSSRSTRGCRILMLTTFGRPGYLRRAMEGGAVGLPAQGRARRRPLVGDPARDGRRADRRSRPRRGGAERGRQPADARASRRCSRRRASHATVAQLALALHLSPGTTRNHLSTIMGKLGAHSRAEALRVAEEKGWL